MNFYEIGQNLHLEVLLLSIECLLLLPLFVGVLCFVMQY